MTTNSRPAKAPRTCVDCHVQLNSSNTRMYRGDDGCDHCMELAGIFNEHQDGMHEDAPVDNCTGCGYVIPDRSRKGTPRPSTTPVEMQSHAACYAAGTHAKTKAGREACRKGRNA